MHGCVSLLGVAALTWASGALGQESPAPASATPAIAGPPVADVSSTPAPPERTRVAMQAEGRGFAYQPSTPPPNAFRLAIGGSYDAIDPAVMFGMNVRVPQFTMDARYGLGDGWSLKGRFNTMFVTTELLLGAGYAQRYGRWSVEGDLTAGLFVGKLAQFGFDVWVLAGDYRPELAVGYDMGKIALTLRGSLILLGPQRTWVGDSSGEFDHQRLFNGHSEMLYVENTTSRDSVWYFGLGLMTTRAWYALWLLFPDSPGLFTYPRAVAGYEF